jgi:hypothetical protein
VERRTTEVEVLTAPTLRAHLETYSADVPDLDKQTTEVIGGPFLPDPGEEP